MTEGLQDFIVDSGSLREPSLLVASDDSKIFLIVKDSLFSNFKKANKVSDLALSVQEGGKFYMIITKDNLKESYDFLKQYPLGAIDIFDSMAGTQKTYCPKYSDTTVIFVTTKQIVQEAEKMGIDLLKVSGITKQVI